MTGTIEFGKDSLSTALSKEVIDLKIQETLSSFKAETKALVSESQDGISANVDLAQNYLKTLTSKSWKEISGDYTAIQAVQILLKKFSQDEDKKDKGFDSGKLDGLAGGKTKQALKNFQSYYNSLPGKEQLTVDGISGPQTIYALLDMAGVKDLTKPLSSQTKVEVKHEDLDTIIKREIGEKYSEKSFENFPVFGLGISDGDYNYKIVDKKLQRVPLKVQIPMIAVSQVYENGKWSDVKIEAPKKKETLDDIIKREVASQFSINDLTFLGLNFGDYNYKIVDKKLQRTPLKVQIPMIAVSQVYEDEKWNDVKVEVPKRKETLDEIIKKEVGSEYSLASFPLPYSFPKTNSGIQKGNYIFTLAGDTIKRTENISTIGPVIKKEEIYKEGKREDFVS